MHRQVDSKEVDVTNREVDIGKSRISSSSERAADSIGYTWEFAALSELIE
jgi:hypothetical protein